MKSTFLASVLFFASLFANAQYHFSGCAVNEVVLAGVQNCHVQLSCNILSLPSCAVATSYFAFDKSTPHGKQLLATVLLAHATGGKLTGTILGHCPTWQTNVAELNHLRLTK